jgi:hypothetical protein
VVLEATPHDEAVVLVHGDVAAIEQSVDIRAKGEAVPYVVVSTAGVRPDMGCFENWQRMLAGDGAGTAVGFKHLDTEDALT